MNPIINRLTCSRIDQRVIEMCGNCDPFNTKAVTDALSHAILELSSNASEAGRLIRDFQLINKYRFILCYNYAHEVIPSELHACVELIDVPCESIKIDRKTYIIGETVAIVVDNFGVKYIEIYHTHECIPKSIGVSMINGNIQDAINASSISGSIQQLKEEGIVCDVDISNLYLAMSDTSLCEEGGDNPFVSPVLSSIKSTVGAIHCIINSQMR